jgi:hypothetical protein
MLSDNFVYRNQSAKNTIKQGKSTVLVMLVIETLQDRSQL